MHIEDVVAVPRDRAAEMAGLSVNQVDYWMRTELLRPRIASTALTRRPIRLYDYTDLMSLMVIAELKRRGVSIQHVRKILSYLRGLGYERPLTEVKFAVGDEDVYIQHSDGTWEGGRRPGQAVIHQVLKLEPMRARIESMRGRDPETIGRTTRRRGALGSKPIIAGTRVPVDTVRRYLDHGASVSDILRAYPTLHESDVATVMRETA